MLTLKDRLRFARQEAKKTQSAVAGAVKMTQSNYSQLETGSALKSVFLPAIANYLGVDALWLESGEESRAAQFIQVDAWDSNTPLDDDEVEIPFYKDFHLACGSGAIGEAMDSETRRLRMSKVSLKINGIETKNACAMTASGDSMTPIINDKDTIYVDRGRKKVKDGKIFALCHGGLFKVKYLYNLPNGGLRIVSANAGEFPEERLTAQEIIDQDFIIEGWVFSWQTMVSW
ncbi:MAG: helix-turn-helix transcriptional regulator [Candidatus Saccharibacteria bacterium]|nr:helix-turn-helix transcriptional regulator [Moraxellaceae bacterium]